MSHYCISKYNKIICANVIEVVLYPAMHSYIRTKIYCRNSIQSLPEICVSTKTWLLAEQIFAPGIINAAFMIKWNTSDKSVDIPCGFLRYIKIVSGMPKIFNQDINITACKEINFNYLLTLNT